MKSSIKKMSALLTMMAVAILVSTADDDGCRHPYFHLHRLQR